MKYILHADDDHSDRWDFKYLVNTIDPSINVLGFSNGLELMQYLGGISDQLLPFMIFLDLRMPIWDGIKTLQAIKNEPRFMSIPVYIWSIADTKREMELCIRSGRRAVSYQTHHR
jgi:CheY-like chemotaxis protein